MDKPQQTLTETNSHQQQCKHEYITRSNLHTEYKIQLEEYSVVRYHRISMILFCH